MIENTLKNLAIIIATQWKTVDLLMMFANSILIENSKKEYSDSNDNRPETIKSCQEFVKFYNEKRDVIMRNIKDNYHWDLSK